MSKKINKFEDLIAWQKARKLTSDVYRVTSHGKFATDYGLKDQIRRAAVSSMSNVAEGFERGGLVEFHRFLAIAKGSCAELRAQLYVALDVGYLNPKCVRLINGASDRGWTDHWRPTGLSRPAPPQ